MHEKLPAVLSAKQLLINESNELRTRLAQVEDNLRIIRAEELDVLRAAEQRMRLATEATGVGIWEWHVSTNQIRWDPQMFRIYGITPTPDGILAYSDWSHCVFPEDLPQQEAILKETASQGGQSSREFRIRQPNTGEYRCIQAVETVRTDASGQIEWVVGTNLDVTERKLVDTAMRESEARLRLFIEHAPASIAMFDHEMCYLAASNRWKQDFGLPDELVIIGRSHYEVFPEIPERWKALHRRGLAGETLNADEDPFERLDGTTQWLKWEVRPWFTADGQVGGILTAAEEVTERMLARKALHQSREDLNRAQAVGQLGSWRLDVGRNVLSWSDENYRIFGVPKETPLTYETFLGIVHPDDREFVNTQWQAALNGTPYAIEHRIVVNKQVKWVREKAYLEFDKAGGLQGAFGITQDITGRKLAELALQEANHQKDAFLAMLAHELRNPLASICNAVHVIHLQGAQEPTLHRATAMIERQVKQLIRLVDDLLDISRVSRGKIVLQKETVEVAAVIRQAVETSQPHIETRQHQLQVELPVSTLRVEGDFTRLAQVVSNVLNNAAKYTDAGGSITVAVAQVGHEAVIRVRDNGRGIDPVALKSLFDLFYQVDRNLDRSDGGLGIGLSLVKSLVDMHGGQVEAHSEGLGKGSEFIIRLPCLSEEAALQATDILANSLAPSRTQRILLVDDNPDVADSMVMLLTIFGHEVLVAHDGKQAVEVALRERPAVVLLDIGLPGMDGYQACRAMRNGGLSDTLIVAMTGYGQEDDKRKAEAAGFDLHMPKPVDVQVLEELLASLPS
ncbi:PAS domain S-box-containing protein [Thiothrix caldifontis]|uniref:histidine kinase n=1 Tax=Thiothrix caldifontis TaxID=525918 RepID=A0A1H4EE88_9GAMM|nr:PAS domain-containing protein [Thiothrix caldifontis]SEA83343.1 PAS domain S-box-containing protein [Thiothrix caldifontis]